MFKLQGTLKAQTVLVRYQVIEAFLMLSIAAILPVLIHLIPQYGSLPWGARLLPMFYAPFIAVLFFKPHVGFFVALCAPALNNLLTLKPDPGQVALLTQELLIFTLFSRLIYRRWPNFLGTAPTAYLLSIGVAAKPLILDTYYGLLILMLINIAAIRIKNK